MACLPLSTFTGHLRQVNSRSVDELGYAALKVCAPAFFPLSDAEVAETAGEVDAEEFSGADAIHILRRPYRRYSGDDFYTPPENRLGSERYFSVARNAGGEDGGTLAEELNAYRDPRRGVRCVFLDCLDPGHAARLGIAPIPYIAVIIPEPEAVLRRFAHEAPLVPIAERCVGAGKAMVVLLGNMIANASIERVVDLRDPATQQAFFEAFFAGPRIIPTKSMAGFTDVLPELLRLPPGGATPENPRLIEIGLRLRESGAYGLIYPSARSNVSVSYEDGALADWHGWSFVYYADAPPPKTGILIDLGGFDTEFPPGVTFSEESQGARTGWSVTGLRAANHTLYEWVRQGRPRPPEAAPDGE